MELIPEQRLLLAVIAQAVTDLVDIPGTELALRERAQAYRWIFSARSDDRTMSFEWCCSMLGWSHTRIQRQLRARFPGLLQAFASAS